MDKIYTHEKEPSELVIKYVHKLKEISWQCDFEKLGYEEQTTEQVDKNENYQRITQ